MNKGLLSFFFISIALLLGAFYFSTAIQSPFISILNSIKSTHHNSVEFVQKKIHEHTFQKETIIELSEKQ